MEVINESAEGLDRRFTVRVSAAELDKRLLKRLENMKGRLHLKGFRKGKAPLSHLKKVYGRGIMGEIVQEIVSETAMKTFSDRNLQPASAPHPHFKGDMEAVISGKADLEYDVHGEVLPAFDPIDVATISLTRLVADIPEADLDEALKAVADNQKTYEARAAGAKAEKGDQLLIDYVGRIDGAEFAGGKGEDQTIVLGSDRFIPGFEDQLIGAVAGADVTVKTTFPEDFGSKDLAGKAAEFAVKVKEVKAPQPVAIDDELAKKVGLDNLDALKKALKERIESDYRQLSRGHLKRALLDKLDAAHSFDLPKGMVDAEFEAIWRQVEGSERDEEDKDKTEDELKKEYRAIAERRVRLGLVLAEIGKRAQVQVPNEELQRAIQQQALREAQILSMQGQKVTPQQVLKFYQQNPGAVAQVRAPLFEEKVVDYIVGKAAVTEKKVTKEELMKEPGEV
ncbi:MAG: trigger factor [Parvularculaceae bacterium]|jgi:trigger factor|nr:trigger factor [Parvularculaceae bacterium]